MNVVILTIARSGSSMVASIFAKHGFDCPRGIMSKRHVDGSQYYTYERPALKAFYKGNRVISGDEMGKFFTYRNTDKFYKIVESLPEPWVIKAGINMWPLFKDLGTVVVKVRRNEFALAKSMATKKQQDYEQTLGHIRVRAMLFNKVPGFEVYTDEIVRGDFSSLLPIFEACGADFSEETALSCLKPKEWHYNEKANARPHNRGQ